MRFRLVFWIALAHCACADERLQPLVDPSERVSAQGSLELPVTVWPDNPRTSLEQGERHGYWLDGAKGGRVTLRMRAARCGEVAPALYLFGPAGAAVQPGLPLTNARASGDCGDGAAIVDFELPTEGRYSLVAISEGDPGGYRLDASCDHEPCRPVQLLDWESSRSMAAGTRDAAELEEIGAFVFDRVFRVSEGLGNARAGATRPNMRLVHDGAFGGPDAQSCVSCHNLGHHGAGALDDDIFQAGDGIHPSSALRRNPPPLRGLGIRQKLAAEISASLSAQREALVAAALGSGRAETASLCVSSVCFGVLTALPDGTIDATGAEGIDEDLVVRPFGWKGRETTVRDFVRGGLRVHFGIQSEQKISDHCSDLPPTPDLLFERTWGNNSANCLDPDEDGVVAELTDGQLDALTIYLMLIPAPAAAGSADPAPLEKAGCTACHVRSLPLETASFVESQTGVTVTLPAAPGEIELWSDFKRHDLGHELADARDFFNDPAAKIAAREFITPPLWDLANSAPYLHDGRAATLRDAILEHDGEAAEARQKFNALGASEQERALAYLAALGAGEQP